MGFTNVKIIGTGLSHGDNEISKEFFIDHFRKMDVEIEGLLNHLGKTKVYRVSDEKDNSITLAEKSCMEALENCNLSVSDVDALIFVTDTPEYLFPSNAMYLSNILGMNNLKMGYDINSNCTGMLLALEQITQYMRNNSKLNKAIIVGSLHISNVLKEDCSVSYPTTSDASVALVLEKAVEEEQRGFISSNFCTHIQEAKNILLPHCGFSHIYDEDINVKEKKLNWNPFDFSHLSGTWSKIIKELLMEKDLSADDINWYIFSQFSKADGVLAMNKLEQPIHKNLFYGHEFGYTGCTSPFLAYHNALKEDKIKPGDRVVLTSVGAGSNMVTLYYIA